MGVKDLSPEEIIMRANERWLKGKPEKKNNWANKSHPWKTMETMEFKSRVLKKKLKNKDT